MIPIEICVGSSCHLKGAPKIVELLRDKISTLKLEDQVALTGAFCSGRCNRTGVTITVGGEKYPGITPDGFATFWETVVLPAVNQSREA